MRTGPTGILLFVLLVAPAIAQAGKVDNVKKAVKDKCDKEIPVELLVSAIVRAYDCEPDREVTIMGCKIKCMKDQNGNVVGK